MEPPAATPPEVDALLGHLLERHESEWASALEELCVAHPSASAALRRRFALLAEVGVVGSVPRPEFLSPGQHFVDYHLLELIGTGGMGVVFRARKDGSDDEVALKVLRPGLLEQPTTRTRFQREVAALADLVHPAVCELVDYGEHAGVPYLAMRLLRGGTLATAVAEARRLAQPGLVAGGSGDGPAWRHVVQLFATLAHGLAAVHARGLVHRDVKPENIVLERGAPVLIDFGLAATSDATRLTRSGEPVGTPAYMAPEQVRGAEVDARTDVYGLAATLYECVALRPPFQFAAREALYRAVLTEDAPDVRSANPELPRSLALVLGKALQKQPTARYATALAFAEELERVAAGMPVRASASPVWQRVWRRARSRPKAAVAGVAVAVALGIGVVQMQLAELAARNASERLAESAVALLQRDVTVGALVAREAWRQLPNSEPTRSGLLLALSRNMQVAEFDVERSVTGYEPSPDGSVALVLTNRIWLREGDRLRQLEGTEVVGPTWQQWNSAAWARDGRSCLVALHGATNSRPPREGRLLRLARDGKLLPLADAAYPGSPNLSFGGLGAGVHVIAALEGGIFVVGDVRGGLRAIDAEGRTLRQWDSPTAPAQIAFVGALANGHSFVTVDANGRVLRWDEPAGVPTELFDTGRWVTAVHATRDCERLAIGDVEGRVHVLAPVPGQHIATVEFGAARPIEALALASNGSALFASAMGQRSAMWELEVAAAPCQPRLVVLDRGLQLVRAATFSADGSLLATVGLAGRLEVLDRLGRPVLGLAVARATPLLVHFTGPRQLVTAGFEPIVREWRLDVPGFPILRAHDHPVLNLAWLPDGGSIVSAGADGRLVWTALDGTNYATYSYGGDNSLLFAMALSPNGQQVVIGRNRMGSLRRLRLDREGQRFALLEPEIGSSQWQSVGFRNEHSIVAGLIGGSILSHDLESGEATEWRTSDGARAHRWAVHIDVGNDGSVVAASEDGSVSLWNSDGRFERTLCTDDSAIVAADFAPDAGSVVLGLTHGRVFVVDRQGKVLRRYSGGMGQVVDARISPDGTLVAAAFSDSVVLVWRAGGDGKPWLRLPLPVNVLPHALAFSPNSEQIAIACSDGAIHVFPAAERHFAVLADSIFRDLGPEEFRSALGR